MPNTLSDIRTKTASSLIAFSVFTHYSIQKRPSQTGLKYEYQ